MEVGPRFGSGGFVTTFSNDDPATDEAAGNTLARNTLARDGLASDDFSRQSFQRQLTRLFQLRRDVRHFRSSPLPEGLLGELVEAACLAPSVGLSQPWRFVSVRDANRRRAVAEEFERQNEVAASRYEDQFDEATAVEYRQLKLAGLRDCPEHLAVFVQPQPRRGRGLGRATMPESVDYSVVAAIQNFWLAARSRGVGVGWVSILRPEVMPELLSVDADWRLIAYLCVGYPIEPVNEVPQLESAGWETRDKGPSRWLVR